MRTPRLQALAAAIVAAPLLSQGDAAPRLTPADAKRLVAEACGTDEKRVAAARATLEATKPEDRKLIADALRALPFTPTKKLKIPADRVVRGEIDAPEASAGKGRYLVSVPKGYDGKRPMPVLFRMHGSGGTAEEFAKAWAEPKQPFVVVTPEIPTEGRIAWNEPGVYQFVDRLYRRIVQDFAVDTERVFLSGHSAGGGGACSFAQLWPHRVAGIYAMSYATFAFQQAPQACMDTMRTVPGYFVVGLADTEERIQAFRAYESHYQKNGLPGVFQFAAGKGHDLMSEYHAKAYEHLAKSSRTASPKEIRGVFFLYGNQLDVEPITSRRWWLEVEPNGYDAPKGAVFHAKIEGNTIDVDAPGIRAGSVLLHDGMVDMDQPVTLRINGKEAHQGTVERSVPFLLDWFASERDRGQLYWNRVRFGK